MLTDAFRPGDIGVNFKFRNDVKLFNLRRLQTKTKFQKDFARDFLFADDCALNAGTFCQYRQRGFLQNRKSQLSLRHTKKEGVGKKRDQPFDQAEIVPCNHSSYITIRMRNMDCL